MVVLSATQGSVIYLDNVRAKKGGVGGEYVLS